jgi:hypothetical protein
MGDLLAGDVLPMRAPTGAVVGAARRPRTPSPRRGTAPAPARGFAIGEVAEAAEVLAARIAEGAPDLAVVVHDPRAAFRAWFGRRSDPRDFFPPSFAAALAPCFAASPIGADRVQLAPEAILPLDAGTAEPGDGSAPVLPPCAAAATWVNDHELGHLADRATTDRRAWFDRFDTSVKHRREVLADGFAHVLAVLRHGPAGERAARARADWRARLLLEQGDTAHFTAYAARPFVELGRVLRAQGVTAETVEPLALARRCRAMAAGLALAPADLEALRTGTPPERLQGVMADAVRRAGRHRERVRVQAVTAEAWLALMTARNPDDAALLRAAHAAMRVERAAQALGTVLARLPDTAEPARTMHGRTVGAFLEALDAMLGHGSRATVLLEDLLRAAVASAGEWTTALLLTLQEALMLAWEGIERGLLPGQLDAPIRGHALALADRVRSFLAQQG